MTTTTTSNNNKAAEMANSPAFRVLTVAAKKLLAIIAREIKAHGEPVPLSNEKLETDFGVPRSSIAPAVRELAALGFIAVEIAGPTHAFRLTDGWRSVQSAKEATIKAAVARQTKSKPPRTDAKPTKHDLDDMT